MAERNVSRPFFLIAHNIRSAYNVGALFRTADGIGVHKVYLTGYTPRPHDGKSVYMTAAEKMIAKTALGAQQIVPWEKRILASLLTELRAQGCMIVALEKTVTSGDYRTFHPRFPLAVIVGNEPRGIDRRVIARCDTAISIPMRGVKSSLNVAVAFGVFGYSITN